MTVYGPGNGLSSDTESPYFDRELLGTVRSKRLSFKPPSLGYSVIAAQTD